MYTIGFLILLYFFLYRFTRDKRELPVLWHQSLLTFVQRYKEDISSEQKEAFMELLRAQSHPAITPDVRRELMQSKCRDTEGPMAMEWKHSSCYLLYVHAYMFIVIPTYKCLCMKLLQWRHVTWHLQKTHSLSTIVPGFHLGWPDCIRQLPSHGHLNTITMWYLWFVLLIEIQLCKLHSCDDCPGMVICSIIPLRGRKLKLWKTRPQYASH